MSISPKLANSTPPESDGWRARHEEMRTNPEVLVQLTRDYDYQLKFVVNPDAGDDLAEIDSLLLRLPSYEPGRILLMAEGVSSEIQHRRQGLLAPICIERGWRLSPRLHIDLFGNTRGT